MKQNGILTAEEYMKQNGVKEAFTPPAPTPNRMYLPMAGEGRGGTSYLPRPQVSTPKQSQVGTPQRSAGAAVTGVLPGAGRVTVGRVVSQLPGAGIVTAAQKQRAAERSARQREVDAELDRILSAEPQAQQRVNDANSALRGASRSIAAGRRSREVPTVETLAQRTDLRTDAQRAQRGLDTMEYIHENRDRQYSGDFGGQFGANFRMGQFGQDEALAWSAYLDSPTEENKQRAEAIGLLSAQTALGNPAALEGEETLPWLSQSLAGYLPQLTGQTKAGLAGAATGGVLGSFAPVVGTVAGAKAGYMTGRAKYGYDTARGRVFSDLLSYGVPEETARQAANDEALISSVIEMADAGLDIATLGLGTVAKKATGSALNVALKTLKKYGINILGEGIQEGVQEGVSIANQRRAQGGETGIGGLAWDSTKLVGNALIGHETEAATRMGTASVEGMKIAAMVGGAALAGNTAAGYALGRSSGKDIAATTDTAIGPDTAIDRAYGAMGEHGVFAPAARAAAAKADARLGIQPWAQSFLPRAGEATAGFLPRAGELDAQNPAEVGGEGQQKTASMGETAERQYTVQRDTDGKIYVQINADILEGKPQSEWKAAVRAEIQRIFARGINLARGTVFSNQKGRGEYSNGTYTRMLERTDPAMYADKLRMANGSDGLLKNAENTKYEDAKHQRKDDIVGFNRGQITVEVKESGYTGDVLTAIYSDGKESFFDINNLSRKKIEAASPERYIAQGDFTQTGDTASDTNIVPQGDVGVKHQFAPEKSELSQRSDTPPEHMTAEEWDMWQAAQARKAERGEPTGAKAEYNGTPATEKLGIRITKPITDLRASQSLRGNEKARYQAGRALDSLLKDTGADEAARRVAQGVADGTFTMQQVQQMGMDVGTIQAIADAYALRNSYNATAIKEQKSRASWDFDAKVQELIKRSDDAKSPSVISLNTNTMQRNNERTWGGDAKAINEELFDPVVSNEAERIRFVNGTLGKMEHFKLSRDESGAVQRLMEGNATEGQLTAEGYDATRIKAAADTLGGLYNDFYEAVNDFLVAHGYREIGFQKNYAPHMQEEQVDTMQRYLQRLGFQTNVSELPTDLAGRTDTFKPGKQYNPYFQPRVGGKTKLDAVGGFESYVNYLSNVFYHTDDIQKLRRFSEALRTKYSGPELSAEMDRLNHLQDRLAVDDDAMLGTESIQDLKEQAFIRYGNMSSFGNYVSVMDDYTNILAGKQSKFDRAVESMFGRKLLNTGREIQNAFSRAAIVGNISSAINQTVQLPLLVAELGPKHTARAVADVATGVTGRTGFNQESDFLTGKHGIQKISGKTASEQIFDVAAKPFEVVDDFASRIIVRAKYLEQIDAGKNHAEALGVADTFANRLVGSRMRGAKAIVFEQKNPLSKLVTTFQLEVANGWQHIVHDLPLEIQTMAKKQGIPAAAARTAQIVVASQVVNFLANSLIKSITGREPVPFDGLGMVVNYLAAGYGMTKDDYLKTLADGGAETVTGTRPMGTTQPSGSFDLPSAMETAVADVGDDIPYLSNVTSMLGLTDSRLPTPQIWNNYMSQAAGKLGEAATAEDDEQRAAAIQDGMSGAVQGLGQIGATWLPMGSQIKKSIQGGTTLARGGAYTGHGDNERLQYSVERTPANMVRGLLFGKSALPETDTYYAEGAKALSTAQTGVYHALVEAGASSKDAYGLIQNLRRTQKGEEDSSRVSAQVAVLGNSGLSGAQQALVYRDLLATDAEKSLMKRLERDGARAGMVYLTLAAIRDGEDSSDKRNALAASSLTDGQKIQIYQDRISSSRDDEIVTVLGAGLSFDDFLEAQNQYTAIGEEDGSAAEKSTEFAKWANDKGFAPGQVDAVREAFKFYSQVPAGETLYDRFVGSGFDSDSAYELAGQLEGVTSIRGDKDRNGNTVYLSSSRNKKAAIDAAISGLTRDERYALYELFNISEKVWGEQVKSTPINSRFAEEDEERPVSGQAPSVGNYLPRAGQIPSGGNYLPTAGQVIRRGGVLPRAGQPVGGGNYLPTAGQVPSGGTYLPTAGQVIRRGGVLPRAGQPVGGWNYLPTAGQVPSVGNYLPTAGQVIRRGGSMLPTAGQGNEIKTKFQK